MGTQFRWRCDLGEGSQEGNPLCAYESVSPSDTSSITVLTMLGSYLMFLMILHPTNIAGDKGIEDLLLNMKNAPNQTEAHLLFDANILGSNITKIVSLKNEDPGSKVDNLYR